MVQFINFTNTKTVLDSHTINYWPEHLRNTKFTKTLLFAYSQLSRVTGHRIIF